MKERLLTVCGQYNSSDRRVPVLILKGQWLEEAGFQIGNRVEISLDEKKLVLENKGRGYGKPYPNETSKRAKK